MSAIHRTAVFTLPQPTHRARARLERAFRDYTHAYETLLYGGRGITERKVAVGVAHRCRLVTLAHMYTGLSLWQTAMDSWIRCADGVARHPNTSGNRYISRFTLRADTDRASRD